MEKREQILKQLYKILENNKTDARIYYRLADNCKRPALKFFFKKLSLQKRIYCRRIRYEIRELEREMEILFGNSKPLEDIQKREITVLPSKERDGIGLINYCYKRENHYLELYENLLSRTYLGNIREMLLSQKHSIHLILNEIRAIENKLFNGKNEGEIKIS